MNSASRLLLVVTMLFLPTLLAAEDVRPGDEAPERVVLRGAEAVGGPVVGIPIDVDLRTLPTLSPWRPGDPLREVPRRDDGSGNPITVPPRLDPLVERQREFDGVSPAITEVHNFLANFSSASPNDPTGDVGIDYFFEAINGSGGTSVTAYDKETGDLVLGPFALDTLAPGGNCASGLGDPIVLFDHLAGRWFLSEFSGGGNRMCVYTSRTADPLTGGWCFYEFADNQFPDYPKYGVWDTMYTATTNKGSGGPDVYGFDRANMLSPDGVNCPTARATQRFGNAPNLPGLGFEAFTPVDLDGPAAPPGTPAYFVRHRDSELNGDPPSPTTDPVELWALDVDFDNAANSTFVQEPDLILSDFDSNLCPPIAVFSCVPQPPPGNPLDPLLEVVMQRASYRNFGGHEMILGVLQTDINDFPDHSGERWFEARRSGAGASFSLFQEGTYSPDSEHRFMGMVSMDGSGNILLGYNVSSETEFPGIRYTGRLATDPLGTMTLDEQTLVTGTTHNTSTRYGDYNQMGVDPVDECTFWFVGMHNEDGRRVQIGAARFDDCGGVLFTDGFESGDTSAWGTVATD